MRSDASRAVLDLGPCALHLYAPLPDEQARFYALAPPGGAASSGFTLEVADLTTWLDRRPTLALAVPLHAPPWGGLTLALNDPDGYRIELRQT